MKRILQQIGRLAHYLAVAAIGFFLGAMGLYTFWVRSGPPLERWHTENLEAEFSTSAGNGIRSFDDYRRLEDRLFAQLDEQVYARTETGPEYRFARYSAGSAADPRSLLPDWNRSFELPARTPAGGVLLLHGMSDSPYSLHALGEFLNRHHYWVIGLRLPGHGTVPAGLKDVTWEDMAAAVRLCMAHLAERVGPDAIHIAGYSTGAPLAVDYALGALEGAHGPKPSSLILISPSIGISPAAALAGLKKRVSALPGLEKFAWTAILPEFDPYKYNSFTTNAADQVHRLTRGVARRVATQSAAGPIGDFPPTLVFLSAVDATVSVDAVLDNLLKHLAPDRHELVLYDINRRSYTRTVLISDPGPIVSRLMADGNLPFRLTLLTNAGPESVDLVARRKEPFSKDTLDEPLNVTWPEGVFSLSHIALPFSPDDRLYGRHRPKTSETIFLGTMAVQGERGILRFSSDWLVRLRHNPFYDDLENRTLEWVNGVEE